MGHSKVTFVNLTLHTLRKITKLVYLMSLYLLYKSVKDKDIANLFIVSLVIERGDP